MKNKNCKRDDCEKDDCGKDDCGKDKCGKDKCGKGIIELYSAQQFDNTVDKKNIGKCNCCERIDLKIKFTSVYQSDMSPSIYFVAIVTLSIFPTNCGNFIKKNITVKDICFKNENNVCLTSRTKEYGYLYNISCSSSEKSCSSSSSSSSCSCCSSSSCSLSSIINKGIEKKIAIAIVNFFDGPYFTINKIDGCCFVTLDVKPDSEPIIFPVAKTIVKYLCISDSSNSSSSSSSSSSSHKCNNNIIKLLILAGIILFIVSLFFKNSCHVTNSNIEPTKLFIGKFKNLLDSSYVSQQKPNKKPIYSVLIYSEQDDQQKK